METAVHRKFMRIYTSAMVLYVATYTVFGKITFAKRLSKENLPFLKKVFIYINQIALSCMCSRARCSRPVEARRREQKHLLMNMVLSAVVWVSWSFGRNFLNRSKGQYDLFEKRQSSVRVIFVTDLNP